METRGMHEGEIEEMIELLCLINRPDGHDPRDQYVGHKRIDVPEINGTSTASDIAKVRFNCIIDLLMLLSRTSTLMGIKYLWINDKNNEF